MRKLTAGAIVLAMAWPGWAGPAAATSEPTISIVQAAYEREAVRNAAKHDKNLVVLAAECSSSKIEGQHLCWITFTSKTDPSQTLYYDVAGLQTAGSDWTLISGMCRR